MNAGRDAQVSAYSQNVHQVQGEAAVNVAKLTEGATGVREFLPQLSAVDGVNADEIEAVTEELAGELAKDEPDHGKLRKLGTQLKDLLGPAASALTIAKWAVGPIAAALS